MIVKTTRILWKNFCPGTYNGGWTLKSVAGDRITLDNLLAADSDFLDNDA